MTTSQTKGGRPKGSTIGGKFNQDLVNLFIPCVKIGNPSGPRKHVLHMLKNFQGVGLLVANVTLKLLIRSEDLNMNESRANQ